MKTEAIPQPRASKKKEEAAAVEIGDEEVDKKSKTPQGSSSSKPVSAKAGGKKLVPVKKEPEAKKEPDVKPKPEKETKPNPEVKKAAPVSKKGSVLFFAKPKTEAPAPVPAPVPVEQAAVVGPSDSKRSASEAGIVDVDQSNFIKRTRLVEVSSRDDTVTFWKGNTLFVVEH